MISGVPEHVDGRMIGITEAAGARLINRDGCGTTLRASGTGHRSAAPRHPHPGPTIVDVVRRVRQTPCLALFPAPIRSPAALHHEARGYDYSWFVLTQSIIKKEFRAVGLGAESRSHRQELADDRQARDQQGRAGAVEAFKTTAPISSCVTILPISSAP